MKCPRCKSDDIEETGKFDLTEINPDNCRHDFECQECGQLFQIWYRAEHIIRVSSPPREDKQ